MTSSATPQKNISTKDGDEISYAEFNVSESKPIIEEIDIELAKHYGFQAFVKSTGYDPRVGM